MLNNCEIGDTMARDKRFYRIGNVQSNHQQETEKADEQTVESDTYVSVSSTKKAAGADYKSICMGANK